MERLVATYVTARSTAPIWIRIFMLLTPTLKAHQYDVAFPPLGWKSTYVRREKKMSMQVFRVQSRET